MKKSSLVTCVVPYILSYFFQVGYAAKEYTDDEEFIEKHVKDLKTEMPYVFEVRDNNLGKSMIYEYSSESGTTIRNRGR